MNRKSFLSCQSFLYPITSSFIQDDFDLSMQSDLKTSATKCCQEILLDRVDLSIEMCYNASFQIDNNSKSEHKCMSNEDQCNIVNTEVEEEIIGPAYFLRQKPTATKTRNAINRENTGTLSNNSNDNKVDSARLDPTLSEIQLILRTANLPRKGMTTPVKKRNKRDLSEVEGQTDGKYESILIANIDSEWFENIYNRRWKFSCFSHF